MMYYNLLSQLANDRYRENNYCFKKIMKSHFFSQPCTTCTGKWWQSMQGVQLYCQSLVIVNHQGLPIISDDVYMNVSINNTYM